MSAPGFAGNRYLLDINGSGGAFTPILAKSPVTRLVVDESQITAEGATNVPQGVIDYQIPNDDTASGFGETLRAVAASSDIIGSASLPIVLGNPIRQHGGGGEIIGQPGQPIVGFGTTAATTMILVRSGTATGTTVMVTEYN